MDELTITKDYRAFKAELDSEIKREAEGFVKIGYLLRLARETDILQQSEYENVNDFAKKEYGLDPSQVSRFISINERFSEGGYSAKLEDKYEGFGVAKLSIMLQLPDAINEELTPEYTKAEINILREEVKEEAKTSDLEVMMEPQEEDPYKAAIKGILELEPFLEERLFEAYKAGRNNYKDIIAPSGTAIKSVRVDGLGRVMLKFDETDTIKFIKVRENVTETFNETNLETILEMIFKDKPEKAPEPKPEKKSTVADISKIAPVQKESKVTKAEPKKAEEPIKKVEEHEAEIIPPESHFERVNNTAEMPSAMPEPEDADDTETGWSQPDPEDDKTAMEDVLSKLEPCEEIKAKCEEIIDFFEHDIQGIKPFLRLNPTIDYLESAVARGLKLVDMLKELIYIKKRNE